MTESATEFATQFAHAEPILRIFDEAKAREFYLDFLGFNAAFEHRFDEGAPLYMIVTRASCVLHLSEHYGDATPGAAVRIATADVTAFAEHLAAKSYKYARPGAPEQMPWGSLELKLTDPFSNRLIFYQE